MECTNVENIDIEKSKALFEYEMTEVILNLKGEFAAVSGKNTRYSELSGDEEKLKVPTITVQEMQLPETKVTFPLVTKVIPTDIPAPVIVYNKANVSEIYPVVHMPDKAVTFIEPDICIPNTQHKNIRISMPPLELEEVTVSVNTNVPLATQPVFQKVELELPKVTMPRIRRSVEPPTVTIKPVNEVVTVKNIWESKIPCISIPSIKMNKNTICIPEISDMRVLSVRTDVQTNLYVAKKSLVVEMNGIIDGISVKGCGGDIPDVGFINIKESSERVRKCLEKLENITIPIVPKAVDVSRNCVQTMVPDVACYKFLQKMKPIDVNYSSCISVPPRVDIRSEINDILDVISGQM